MAFNIGDRVVIRSFEFGETAPRTIVDKFYSEKFSQFRYMLEDSEQIFSEAELEIATAPEAEHSYEFKFDIVGNVVIAMMYSDGEEISSVHGHVIHSGKIGVAQAASYALKKIYLEMNGGKM